MPSKRIFISHSTKDKDIAYELVSLMQLGLGLHPNDIFCTSLEGMGITAGQNFISFIKEQITEPDFVVLLLSPSYYKSKFCLCELGASWILCHNMIPILIPPLEHNDIKDVLTTVQILDITNNNQLDQIPDIIYEKLKDLKKTNTAVWTSKKEKFVKNILEIIKNKPKEPVVNEEKYKKLDKDYRDAVDEITKLNDIIEKKERLIEKLTNAKDAEQVKNILHDELDNVSKFEKLVSKCNDCLGELSNLVVYALYKSYVGGYLKFEFGKDDYNNELNEAIEDGFLIGGEEIVINEDKSKVSRAKKILNELKNFIDNLQDNSFFEYYEKRYDEQPDIESRAFWKEHFDLRT
jgi:Txe/YoeB family toxin of Txe-Axe toxin-antitoxin module